MTDKIKKRIVSLSGIVMAIFCVRGLYDTSKFHNDFKLLYGFGVSSIHSSELIYDMWYTAWGLCGAAALSIAFFHTNIHERAQRLFDCLARRKRASLVALSLFAVSLVVTFRALVLLDAPIADDESTYVFIARTLLGGHLINPLPADAAQYANQFIVMNDNGWFGKYPIGHPLILTIGELLGSNYVVGPLIAALSLLLTFIIGQKIFGEKVALLGVLLLSASPHFLWTGATLLSQTSSTLFMLLGLLFTIQYLERGTTWWGIAAASAWGYGVVTRPFPGALFLAAVFTVVLLQKQGTPFLRHIRKNLRFLIPVALFALVAVGILFLVNQAQTGSSLKSGYHAAHGNSLGIGHGGASEIAASVGGALLRQNFWLFGWSVSLLFVWFMRRNQYFFLIVGLIGAEYLYRIVVPKTVVATTGPIYVTEIVPLLALATASGIAELKRKLEAHGFPRAKQALISITLASTLVALCCFWPVQIKNIHAGARQWTAPFRALEAAGVDRALVFSDMMVHPQSGASWAYYPPPPSPTLDDDIIFVRVPENTDHPGQEMLRFWRRRYPNRPAFFYDVTKRGSELISLSRQ